MSKTAVWISVGTLVASMLALVPGYLLFFDRPDLVYEMQIENIPLPKDLPGQLPDTLAIITVQNVGRRPSTDVQGSVSVSGDMIEYQVQGPNPAYGRVSYSRKGLQILFSCDRLASGEYPIRISAWYRGANSGPDVGVADARGGARKVNSIAAENAKYKELGTGVLGLAVGLMGSFAVIWSTYRAYAMRKSISEAARQIRENADQLRLMTDEIGTMRGQPPRDEQ